MIKKYLTVAYVLCFCLQVCFANTKEKKPTAVDAVNPSELARGMFMYQQDADLLRLEHLEYWTGLIEKYHKIKGFYPLQNTLKKDTTIGLVKIVTKSQKKILLAHDFDNNKNGRFAEVDIAELVLEIEKVLNTPVVEKYDIQRYPTISPIGYNYFYTKDGYLMWVTCITCGVTKISTLLLDGHTPTLNIVSSGMKDKVTKGMLRTEMLNHPIYKQWKSIPFTKELYVRGVEKDNSRDSKK